MAVYIRFAAKQLLSTRLPSIFPFLVQRNVMAQKYILFLSFVFKNGLNLGFLCEGIRIVKCELNTCASPLLKPTKKCIDLFDFLLTNQNEPFFSKLQDCLGHTIPGSCNNSKCQWSTRKRLYGSQT